MQWRAQDFGRTQSVRSIGFIALAAFGLAAGGCRTSEDLEPSRTPDRSRGSFIANALAERAPPAVPDRPTPPKPKAKPFLSPFGQSIVHAPTKHLERSVGGRDLNFWVVGEGPKTVLVIGGIHGDERSSAECAYDLLQAVLHEPALVGASRVVIAPEVNPDGIAANTRRNQNGVDLNRNFPAENWREDDGRAQHAPGPHASSEPETRFVLALLERFDPECVVATHAAAACVNWDGPAESLARRMSRECGLPAKDTIGYATPGSLGSLLGIDRAVPTITLELARRDSVADGRDAVRRALLVAIREPDAPLAE